MVLSRQKLGRGIRLSESQSNGTRQDGQHAGSVYHGRFADGGRGADPDDRPPSGAETETGARHGDSTHGRNGGSRYRGHPTASLGTETRQRADSGSGGSAPEHGELVAADRAVWTAGFGRCVGLPDGAKAPSVR